MNCTPAHTLPGKALLFKRVGLAALTLICGIAVPLQAEESPVNGADLPEYRALMDGRVEEAQSLLRAKLAISPTDAFAHQLLCRVYYAVEQPDPAVQECEKATAADAHSSANFLWLGRAYGMKAERANPLAAFSLARRVRAAFETATRLDPDNQGALGDLAEYYVEAPAIVGGGDDKARDLANRILPQFPSTAHGILALVAQAAKDNVTAEREFRLAISTARGNEAQSDAWMDLARFYKNSNRRDEAAAAVQSGLALDREHGPVLVDAASILISINRDAPLAEHCLRTYLTSRAHSDAAPVFKVHLQLARLLAARGETVEAGREAAAAAALAPTFRGNPKARGI